MTSPSESHEARPQTGITRRDLLRRGALVGGTLIWATPVLQSLTPPAYAQYARCGCCYCWSGDRQSPSKDSCIDNGSTGILANADTCRAWCESGAPSAPFDFSEYCSATTSCVCHKFGEGDPQGCTCF